MSTLTKEQKEKLVLDSYALLQKNIAPAELANTQANADLLFKHVRKTRGNIPTTVVELAAALEEAATQITDKLQWDVLPAKLMIEKLQGYQPEKPGVLVDKRIAQQKAVDEKTAYEKKQKAAEEQIKNLIDSFSPASRIPGSVDYRTKDAVQAQLRKHVETERSRGVDFTEVAKVVSNFINEKYAEIEKSISRM